MRKLYIDIETIPDNLESMPQVGDLEFYTPAEAVKVPGNLKKQETIDKWHEEKRPLLEQIADEKAVRQTQEKYEKAYNAWSKGSFDQIDCRIVAISYAFDNGNIISLSGEENHIISMLVHDLWMTEEASNPNYNLKWIAFNAAFDLSIITAKCLKYGFTWEYGEIPWNFKPWDTNKVFDPMLQFPHQNRKWHSQDKIAKLFGIESKTVMSGKDILPYYLAGKHQLISEYCAEDVEVLRKIEKRLCL